MCRFHSCGHRYPCSTLFSWPTQESCIRCIQCSSTPRWRNRRDVMPYSRSLLTISTAGLLTTYASWRWAFYLQGILTVVFAVAVHCFVPSDSKEVTRREPIDWFGALLVSGGLCSFCFALTDAETSPDGWGTSYIIVALILGVGCITLFLWLQSRLRYPLMPLSIWRYPQFPRVIATYFLGFTTFAGVLIFNYTLMWQMVNGRSAVGVNSSYNAI
jgi:MFS family permease